MAILNYGCNYVIYTGWITLIAVLAILNGSLIQLCHIYKMAILNYGYNYVIYMGWITLIAVLVILNCS